MCCSDTLGTGSMLWSIRLLLIVLSVRCLLNVWSVLCMSMLLRRVAVSLVLHLDNARSTLFCNSYMILALW